MAGNTGTKQIRIGRVARVIHTLRVEKAIWEKKLEDKVQEMLNKKMGKETIMRECTYEMGRFHQAQEALLHLYEAFPELKEEK